MSTNADAGPDPRMSSQPETGSVAAVPTRRFMLVGALIVLLFVSLAGFTGYQVGRSGDAPVEGGADVGFSRDMQTHHNQAVQMALIIRDKTADPTLRAVAYDIATSQSQQAGQMYGWLAHWGLPATSPNQAMAWMTAGQHQPEDDAAGSRQGASPQTPATTSARPPTGSHGMPGMSGADETSPTAMGMATPEQLQSLKQATDIDAERQFLTLMIAHHKGGVQMAQAALRLASKPEVLNLARAIDTAQTVEITQLQQLLEARR